jgi:tetratricopeptide (TPR) repeat protein
MRSLVVVVGLLVARHAYADEDMTGLDDRTQQMAQSLNADARPHFVLGYKAFNAKDYKTATAEFEIAYRLDPEVPLLFTWAQSERLGGNCKHAIELYQKYLYSDINKDQAAFTRERIHECGGIPQAKPTASPTISPALPPPQPEQPELPAEPVHYVWYRDVPADVLSGAGAVSLLAGLALFIEAHGTSNDAAAAFYLDDHERLRSDAIHQRNLGIGATIAGALIGGAGVALYVYHGKRAAVTTDGHGVALALRW